MEFHKLDKQMDLDALFNDAEINKKIEAILTIWYNVENDPGLSEMILQEIIKVYAVAKKY